MKLIQFYQFGEWELYDLNSDPDELTNLYGKPEYADRVAAMKQELIRLQEQYDDDSGPSEMPASWQRERRNGKTSD